MTGATKITRKEMGIDRAQTLHNRIKETDEKNIQENERKKGQRSEVKERGKRRGL